MSRLGMSRNAYQHRCADTDSERSRSLEGQRCLERDDCPRYPMCFEEAARRPRQNRVRCAECSFQHGQK